MKPKIRVLSEQTINQIAAGEVIENPASVIKELIENAIDAKATQIIVELQNGGFGLIRIIDNGTGMQKEDLILSLTRHATSKIRDGSDLESILSMGFRGEALASIGAIAKLKLQSRFEKEREGNQVEIEGGDLGKCLPCSRDTGTTIEVRSLFYNVPARKKFQKSPTASFTEIMKIMTKLSLAHPKIGFTLFHQEREIFSYKPCEENFSKALEKRAKKLLGENFVTHSYPIDQREGGFSITGCIGSPREVRVNRLGQHLFINQRAVICPAISYAIYDGYATRLPERKHPNFLLHLTLPTEFIDVNVHPQKKEIRLKDDVRIKNWIRKKVTEALRGQALQNHVSFAKETFDASEVFSSKKTSTFEDTNLAPSYPSSMSSHYKNREGASKNFASSPTMAYKKWDAQSATRSLFEEDLSEKLEVDVIGMDQEYIFCKKDPFLAFFPELEKEDKGSILVNLKNCFTTILYEEMLESLSSSQNTTVFLESLLVPISFDLATDHALIVESHIRLFSKIGLSVRSFGKNHFVIDAMEGSIDPVKAKDLVEELILAIGEKSESEIIEDKKSKQIANIAAKYFQTKNKVYTLMDAKKGIEKLLLCKSPRFSPKGKENMVFVSYTVFGKEAYESNRKTAKTTC